MGRNPFLEVEDSAARRRPRRRRRGRRRRASRAASISSASAPIADAPYDRDNWQQSSSSVRAAGRRQRHRRAGPDGRRRRPAPAPARPDQRAAADAARPRAGQRDRRIARRRRLPAHRARRAAATMPACSPAVEAGEMQIALKRVQSLEPAGRRRAQRRRVPAAAAAGDRRRRTSARWRARSSASTSTALAAHDIAAWRALLERTPADDRGRLRAHPPPRPAAGLALRRVATPVRHARRDRAQGARRVDGDAEPGDRAAGAAEPGLRRDVPAPSRRASTASWRAHLQEARWTVRNVEQRFSTILDGRRGDPEAAAALPRVRADGDEAARPARDRRRGRPARVDRLARHQQQVHGDAGRRVRAEVLLLARDGDGAAAAPARRPRSAA